MQRLTSSCCTRLSSFCCTRLSSSQCKLLLCLFLPPSCTEWSGPAQVEEINDQRWSSQLNWYLLQSLATCLWSTEATSLSVTWICNEPWEWGRWGSSCSSQKTSEDQCVLLRARFGHCSDLAVVIGAQNCLGSMSYSTVNNVVSYLIRKSFKLEYVFQMKIISSGLIMFRSNYPAPGLE